MLTILCASRMENLGVRPIQQSQVVKLAFYNVENLFDTWDDTCVNDEDFLPWGLRLWNEEKLKNKLDHIAKVLIGLGKWDMPVLIGLCEVENRLVIERLTQETPLSSWPFKIVHFESPDHRGIDVALLYNEKHFEVLKADKFHVSFDQNDARGTRDILYVKGHLINADTLHVFINHWPSRYGDYAYTSLKRQFAARVLVNKVDSLLKAHVNPALIILGDFNDEPWDQSIRMLENESLTLVNLMSGLKEEGADGTMKYQTLWHFFDQILVSSNLLPRCKAYIYSPEFLLMDDDKYFGKKPFRTYYGMDYLGGFSDHLPVYVELEVGN